MRGRNQAVDDDDAMMMKQTKKIFVVYYIINYKNNKNCLKNSSKVMSSCNSFLVVVSIMRTVVNSLALKAAPITVKVRRRVGTGKQS